MHGSVGVSVPRFPLDRAGPCCWSVSQSAHDHSSEREGRGRQGAEVSAQSLILAGGSVTDSAEVREGVGFGESESDTTGDADRVELAESASLLLERGAGGMTIGLLVGVVDTETGSVTTQLSEVGGGKGATGICDVAATVGWGPCGVTGSETRNGTVAPCPPRKVAVETGRPGALGPDREACQLAARSRSRLTWPGVFFCSGQGPDHW